MAIVPDIFRNIADKLQNSASVKTVYGEPVGDRQVAPIVPEADRQGIGAFDADALDLELRLAPGRLDGCHDGAQGVFDESVELRGCMWRHPVGPAV